MGSIPVDAEDQAFSCLRGSDGNLDSFDLDVATIPVDRLVPTVVAMFISLGLVADCVYSCNEDQPSRLNDQRPKPQSTPDGTLQLSGTPPMAANAGLPGFSVLWRFVQAVQETYRPESSVPYHNFYHCVDVTHATYLLIKRLRVPARMTSLECFALMVAAVGHDMDHPGVGNSYLINSRDPLALTYNDLSVLENRHVACLYSLVRQRPESDVFEALDPSQWREVRKLVVATVLHTDMAKHFPMVSKLRAILETPNEKDAFLQSTSPEDRSLLLCIILHVADISNPSRPPYIAERWADRILEEFFRQGDKERGAGHVISPLCDSSSTSKPGSQLDFLEFIVIPLFVLLYKIFPEIWELVDNAFVTWQHWHMLQLSELSGSPAGLRAEARDAAFRAEYREVMEQMNAKRKRKVKGGSNFPPRRSFAACIPQGGAQLMMSRRERRCVSEFLLNPKSLLHANRREGGVITDLQTEELSHI